MEKTILLLLVALFCQPMNVMIGDIILNVFCIRLCHCVEIMTSFGVGGIFNKNHSTFVSRFFVNQ